MKKHGRDFAILLCYGFLLLAGCVTTPPPSPIDLSVTKIVPEKEAIIFGRVKVLMDNEPVYWGNCKEISFGVAGYVRCFVIWVEDEVRAKKFSYFLSGDGTFYWHLPPGDYMIGAWKLISGASTMSSFYGVRFNVSEGDSVVYIGTLTVSPIKLGEENRIEDEYDQAFQGLKNEFPAVTTEPIRKIMEFRHK